MTGNHSCTTPKLGMAGWDVVHNGHFERHNIGGRGLPQGDSPIVGTDYTDVGVGFMFPRNRTDQSANRTRVDSYDLEKGRYRS